MKKDLRNARGQIIGFISEGVLCKKVKGSIHKMRIIDGYAMDKRILDNEDFTEVRILDTETDTIYASTKERWLEHGVQKNFGHGDQIILPMKYCEVISRKQKPLL